MAGIVFVARGNGFGHAARDLRIMRGLRDLCPGADISLASSGSGLEYFRARGVPCHDLGIADRNDLSEEAARSVWKFLQAVRDPDLVIADEVVWALPFCRRYFDCPRVLLTDWLYADNGLPQNDPFLDAASEILMLDFAEAHPGPYATRAPITFTGPVVDIFPGDRSSARRHLGLGDDSRVAVVTAGGRTDRQAGRQIFRLAADAWSAHAGPADILFVLGDPEDGLTDMPRNVKRLPITPCPETYYQAADVVMTQATGFTSFEVAANGIPVVAMLTSAAQRGLGQIRFRSRLALLESARLAVTAHLNGPSDLLWEAVAAALELPRPNSLPPAGVTWATGPDIATRLVASCPRALTGDGTRGARTSAGSGRRGEDAND